MLLRRQNQPILLNDEVVGSGVSEDGLKELFELVFGLLIDQPITKLPLNLVLNGLHYLFLFGEVDVVQLQTLGNGVKISRRK